MIYYHNEEYFAKTPVEKQRMCINCIHRQAEPSRCKLHDMFLHYETVFVGWCKNWKIDNESIPDWKKEIEEEYEYLHWDIR